MADETVRMGRLIQDLRDLSLAEINELTLHKEAADINVMLERAVSMLQPLCDEKDLTVQLNLSRDLPSLVIDIDRINQVIYNLLNNAIRYIERGCAITVSTLPVRVDGKSYAQVQIADTGKGIAEENISRVFDRFAKLDSFTQGTGLGLSICELIIKHLGGEIGVESSVGKGSTFWCTVPTRK